MREQLIQYVNLLFAGAPEAFDIKEEILQNTLDRYDDLISQGKTPESAYSLAISGIGDLSELLGSRQPASQVYTPPVSPVKPDQQVYDPVYKRIFRVVAIALYIISVIPLFILEYLGMEIIGLCGTISIVAVATVFLLLGKKTPAHTGAKAPEPENTPRQELRKSIRGIIFALGMAAYFIVSFSTGAWYITWVIFPIIGAVNSLINACIDLKEACEHEA